MPVDLTTALGRLLSDAPMRAELHRDPMAVAQRLDVDPADLKSVDLEGLELQAEALVEKRFHEVSKLLPKSLALLGLDASRIFREYAGSLWPQGERRHAGDAEAFGRFLEERELPRSRSELQKLRFAMGSRPWTLRLVPDAWVGGRRHRALLLLYRRRGEIRSLAFYLGF